MALKTAKMFKDFYVSASSDNSGIMLTPIDIVEVKVKNDNFASRVEILNNSGVDFFSFKYITFDDSNLFEISDAMYNGKYVTLFLNYLSNIPTNAYNDTFFIEAVTASDLKRIGIDLTEFFAILGKNAVTQWKAVPQLNSANGSCVYALKLRFSQYPEDLTNAMLWDVGEAPLYPRTATVSTDRGNEGGKSYVQSIYGRDSALPDSDDLTPFNQFDNAIVMYLILPRQNLTINAIANGQSCSITATLSEFIEALSKLINDLLLSAEITVLSPYSIYGVDYTGSGVLGYTQKRTRMKITDNGFDRITINFMFDGTPSTNTVFGGLIRFYSLVNKDVMRSYPVICCDSDNVTLSPPTGTVYRSLGIYDAYTFEKITFRTDSEKNRLYFSVKIFNNLIDISQCRYNYFYIQRKSQGLRVYIDVERNIYTDIDTTFEYAKNAYSNYEAYKKANIDLVQEQQKATLKLSQKNARIQQTIKTIYQSANAALNSAEAAGEGFSQGGWAGAIIQGLQSLGRSALNIGESETLFYAQQLSERANLALAQEQEHERARETILISEDLAGRTAYTDIYATSSYEVGGDYLIYFMQYLYADIDTTNIIEFSNYVYENKLLNKIFDITDDSLPEWQIAFDFYQKRIAKKSQLNTNKTLTVYAHGNALSLHTVNVSPLGSAEHSSGRWIYNMKVTGDGFQFALEVNKSTDVYMLIMTDGNTSTMPISFAEYFDATWGGYAFDDIGGVIPIRGSKKQFYDKMPIYVGKFSAYTIDSGSFVEVKLKKNCNYSFDFGEIVLVTTVPDSVNL